MPSKMIQDGRLTIKSGDAVQLVKVVDFDTGDFSHERSQPVEQIKVRNRLRELRRGEEQAVTFSFSAIYQDKTLRRCLDQFIWDGQAENLTGLTGGAVNNDVAVSYPYEQNSLQPAASETGFTKIAVGGTPSSDGEIAEELGALDVEGVTVVGNAAAATPVPGEFSVQMPAADTDLSVVYDAVGQSTKDPATSDVKTFQLVFEELDPTDPSRTTVLETFTLDDARVETMPQEEGSPNTISFEGFAYVTHPIIS